MVPPMAIRWRSHRRPTRWRISLLISRSLRRHFLKKKTKPILRAYGLVSPYNASLWYWSHCWPKKKHASGAITIENVGQTVIHPRHREKKIGNDTESNVSCKRGRLIKKKTPKGLVGFLFALAHRCLTRSIPVIASAVFYGPRNGPLSDLPLRARKKTKKKTSQSSERTGIYRIGPVLNKSEQTVKLRGRSRPSPPSPHRTAKKSQIIVPTSFRSVP